MATDEFAGNGAEMQVPKWKRGERAGWYVNAPGDSSYITIVETGRKAPVAMVCSTSGYDDTDRVHEYATMILALPGLIAAARRIVGSKVDPRIGGRLILEKDVLALGAALRKAGGGANG